MHARKIEHEDGRYSIELCWSFSEMFLLTRHQHRVFGKLVELQAAEVGRDSLLQPDVLQALFDLASRPWWDAHLSPLAQEIESEMEPAPESGPAA